MKKPYLPIIFFISIVLIWLTISYGTLISEYINLEMLRKNRYLLKKFVNNHFFVSIIVSCIVFFLTISLMLPGGSIITVTLGFMFGGITASLLAIIIGTLASYLPFILSRKLFYNLVHKRFNKWVSKIDYELQKNAKSYLISMRLNPIIPLIVQNTVPGVLKISKSMYLTTTFIGLIPPTIGFAYFGSGLSKIFDTTEKLSLSALIPKEMIIGLIIISFLSLLPALINLYKRK